MDELTLRPIGIVHSPVGEGREMSIEGVAAEVEVHADYAEGPHDTESNTHSYVLVGLHRASRSLLASEPARGVFGLRSPARPNPIGLSAAKLLRLEGRMLHLHRLDMFDGTPASISSATRRAGTASSALVRELKDHMMHYQRKLL
jgi:tRNA-Thr(GGU) m(6)t(6)A37 methyltransferase TsaA